MIDVATEPMFFLKLDVFVALCYLQAGYSNISPMNVCNHFKNWCPRNREKRGIKSATMILQTILLPPHSSLSLQRYFFLTLRSGGGLRAGVGMMRMSGSLRRASYMTARRGRCSCVQWKYPWDHGSQGSPSLQLHSPFAILLGGGGVRRWEDANGGWNSER